MTLSFSSAKEVTTRSNDEAYFLPVDFELIQHHYLISQELIKREAEEEDLLDDFEGIEIEYSVSSFVEGYLTKSIFFFIFKLTYQMNYHNQLLRRTQVQELTGLSKTSINKRMNEGDFPQSIALSPKTIRCDRREIDKWIDLQIFNARNS